MIKSRCEIINYPWLDTFLKSMPGSGSDYKEEWEEEKRIRRKKRKI